MSRFKLAALRDRLVGLVGLGSQARDDASDAKTMGARAVLLFRQASTNGDVAGLDSAIESMEGAVAAIPTEDPFRAGVLSELGVALRVRFGWLGSDADLDRSIEVLEESVAASPTEDPRRAVRLHLLAGEMIARFGATLNRTDLERSVELMEEAVAGTPRDDPNRAPALNDLSASLRVRSQFLKGDTDLNRSIELLEESLAATTTDAPGRPERLSNLGLTLRDRFWRTGNRADLDNAIEALGEALAATPTDHPNRARRLFDLGSTLRKRSDAAGSRADLDNAIEALGEALAATPTDHPNRARRLSELGLAVGHRFYETGDRADSELAMALLREAVSTTPTDHPDRVATLINLSGEMVFRFTRLGDGSDLDQSVALLEEAVAATPTEHPDRVTCLSGLGNTLRIRYFRNGDGSDLDQSVALLEEAVAATPTDDPHRATCLSSLASTLVRRFEETGKGADLDQSVVLLEEAVAATPTDDPHRVAWLANLGESLHTRSVETGSGADLDRSVALLEEVVATTTIDHPIRAGRLYGLGRALQSRFGVSGNPADYDGGASALRSATRQVSAPVHVRALSARRWGLLAVEAGEWRQAAEAYESAVGLRALLAPRWLGRADQEHLLGELADVGPEAAAACVQAGKVDRAVELFEQGRAVLFSQVLDARSDITDLEANHPELAEEYTRLRDEPDPRTQRDTTTIPDIDGDRLLAAQVPAGWQRDTAIGFERLVEQIRELPGFERFLLPLPIAQLLPAAAEGPVALVNVAQLRCDAFILTTKGIDVKPLPGIDPEAVARQVETFLDALSDTQDLDPDRREAAERRLGRVLAWVWDGITGPILNHLGLATTPADGGEWPRIWWCPTGPLAMLPLHAAGYHDTRSNDSPDTVIDRVVSSTIPSLRALLRSRRPSDMTDSLNRRLLVVAMPHTPGHPDLPGSRKEAEFLAGLLPGQVDVVGQPGGQRATFATVSTALPTHRWVHFSCHGASDLQDPSSSHLLLDDHQSHPLTVLDLTRARLEDVELAFLSACTTARTGTMLPDEPIHLAAACQLAGYRHVIATLWPIGDTDAIRITRRFYATLTSESESPAAHRAAVALHAASRSLRHFLPDQPSRWAPHSHSGP